MKKFKHTIWPIMKMKIKYWWWIIRYRGKKNIPLGLIFNEIGKNMENLSENLFKALQDFPTNITENERDKFAELFQEVCNLGEEINKAKNQDNDNK